MFKIKNLVINKNTPPVIIAEIGINHNGSIEKAIKIANDAILNGADIIKHQTHVVDDEMADNAKKIIPGNSTKSIYHIIKKSALSEEHEFKLKEFIEKKKKIFISTPFSRAAVDRLEKFGVCAYKIGSGECNNYPLVEYISKKRKPIILSTGMNDIANIKKTVSIFKKFKINFALLHCTNIYPTPEHLVRLECISKLKSNFKNIVIGFSDHTIDNASCLGAVALGAQILERHYVHNKKLSGPDISCSMNGKDLRDLKYFSKKIFHGLKGEKKALKEEKKTINFAFASVAAIKTIEKNEKLTEKNIFTIRPYNGYYKVKDYYRLLGKTVTRKIYAGEQLKKYDVK
jgi:N-acetylneuraminate synthase